MALLFERAPRFRSASGPLASGNGRFCSDASGQRPRSGEKSLLHGHQGADLPSLSRPLVDWRLFMPPLPLAAIVEQQFSA